MRRRLRKVTTHTEQDLDILIAHLKGSGKMTFEQIGLTDDPEMLICKFGSVKTKIAEKLTSKEKAKYALETQNKKIDEKIKDYY